MPLLPSLFYSRFLSWSPLLPAGGYCISLLTSKSCFLPLPDPSSTILSFFSVPTSLNAQPDALSERYMFAVKETVF
ncbi:hypothetical protein ILYODFUR_025501 [Ilyodon furcidens]|uniref:Secreted protein n=1 Tax=Ilyodon furcidens TaxID=33524 RepID=A0ABV0TBD8_9TELE